MPLMTESEKMLYKLTGVARDLQAGGKIVRSEIDKERLIMRFYTEKDVSDRTGVEIEYGSGPWVISSTHPNGAPNELVGLPAGIKFHELKAFVTVWLMKPCCEGWS